MELPALDGCDGKHFWRILSLLLIFMPNWVDWLSILWPDMTQTFPSEQILLFSSEKSPLSNVLPKGLPSGFVQLHTLWGQGHTMPRGGTSFQEAGHSSSCEPGGRHLVAGQESGRL